MAEKSPIKPDKQYISRDVCRSKITLYLRQATIEALWEEVTLRVIYVGDPLGHQTGMARETCEVVQAQPSNLSDFVHSS